MYSSRSRNNTERFRESQKIRHAVATLLAKLPADLKNGSELDLLKSFGDHKVYSIVHLIYRAQQYEGDSKDYDFSRRSMEEHWRAGYYDTVRSLRYPDILERPSTLEGVVCYDVAESEGG